MLQEEVKSLFNSWNELLGNLSSNDGTVKKASLENWHLGNGDDFFIIVRSSYPLLLTEPAANGLVEAPLKLI